ncbi:F-box protein SKIP24 isoform X1 [Carex littledalei]|uniref:F-box protein SKIP24 isoform X1 n=1 Tax=Carex littledalei TaxID=544730 RepID=A0A833R2B2_9POAL|nr:F-box protein SKIP24 isoform X1 [Carex littledalei]
MESLPDDVWHKILQIGIQEERLEHTDLCSLAIVNSHFDQLTQDPALWATLVSRDFPSFFSFFQVPSKALYRREHKAKREHERLLNIWNNDTWYDEFWPFEPIDYTPIQFSHSAILVNSGPQLNLSDDDLINFYASLRVLSFREERDQVLPQVNQPSLREARNRYYESKLSKRFDKSSRTKVIPNSKSYIPMNRPPRRSMPRKI